MCACVSLRVVQNECCWRFVPVERFYMIGDSGEFSTGIKKDPNHKVWVSAGLQGFEP